MPATSKAQQRLMGIAYAVKMGYMKLTDVAPEYIDKVKELSNSMTTQQLKDFASTDTKDLPEKADEGMSFAANYNSPQGASMPGAGMGDIKLPDMSTGATGSGDKASGQGDAEEEYKKEKKKRKKLLQKLKTYEAFITEKYGNQ